MAVGSAGYGLRVLLLAVAHDLSSTAWVCPQEAMSSSRDAAVGEFDHSPLQQSELTVASAPGRRMAGIAGRDACVSARLAFRADLAAVAATGNRASE
jgi:hypothetical protein